MQATLNHTHTIYQSFGAAQVAAAAMQSGDDDWTYSVVVDPNGSGRAIVAMHDEDGIFVANA